MAFVINTPSNHCNVEEIPPPPLVYLYIYVNLNRIQCSGFLVNHHLSFTNVQCGEAASCGSCWWVPSRCCCLWGLGHAAGRGWYSMIQWSPQHIPIVYRALWMKVVMNREDRWAREHDSGLWQNNKQQWTVRRTSLWPDQVHHHHHHHRGCWCIVVAVASLFKKFIIAINLRWNVCK